MSKKTNSATQHSAEVIRTCRNRLLQMRADLLNRLSVRLNVSIEEKSTGDEIDQAVAQGAEDIFALHQSRIRHQLLEVEHALQRIQEGRYGICEETEELIEPSRLMALPATRFSLEGAEMREALAKKYALTS